MNRLTDVLEAMTTTMVMTTDMMKATMMVLMIPTVITITILIHIIIFTPMDMGTTTIDHGAITDLDITDLGTEAGMLVIIVTTDGTAVIVGGTLDTG